MPSPTFGSRLQTLRLERGLSTVQLAKLAGTTRTYISDLEAGRRNPSLVLASKLADALGVSLDDLRPRN